MRFVLFLMTVLCTLSLTDFYDLSAVADRLISFRTSGASTAELTYEIILDIAILLGTAMTFLLAAIFIINGATQEKAPTHKSVHGFTAQPLPETAPKPRPYAMIELEDGTITKADVSDYTENYLYVEIFEEITTEDGWDEDVEISEWRAIGDESILEYELYKKDSVEAVAEPTEETLINIFADPNERENKPE